MRIVILKLVWRYGNYRLACNIIFFLSLAYYRKKGSQQMEIEPNPSILWWHKMSYRVSKGLSTRSAGMPVNQFVDLTNQQNVRFRLEQNVAVGLQNFSPSAPTV